MVVVFAGVISFLLVNCQSTGLQNVYGRGETFPVLMYPQGIGTLLLFYNEMGPLFEKIRFDVSMVSSNYKESLRTVFIEAIKKPQLIDRHHVQELPSLILFDKSGTEVYRWGPVDFTDNFSGKEIEKLINKMIGKQ